MIIGVKDVEYIREYIIKVTFDNNESKIVDLKILLKEKYLNL